MIQIAVTESPEDVSIIISDNGRGLPVQGRERLTEPYVTTRARGTGLGLAIVKKIMEDHGGLLALGDREGGGATIRMIFRKQDDTAAQAETETEPVRAAHGG
jgi:two-component system nitrogen regulation sensor histidine kinase NtrY